MGVTALSFLPSSLRALMVFPSPLWGVRPYYPPSLYGEGRGGGDCSKLSPSSLRGTYGFLPPFMGGGALLSPSP